MTHSLQSASSSSTLTKRTTLQRLIAAGNLRYWIIVSWALALATTAPPAMALGWMIVALASGLARTVVETRITLSDPVRHARLKLFTAFVSCAAWAAAPVIAFTHGDLLGEALAVGLLVAGYTLVFTQMRAAPKEALIVSAPYSAVTALLIASQWGTQAFWVLAAIVPVMGLSLLIKVVVTQMKDDELTAVNARQASLIAELQAARDKADAANAAKSNFLGVISHELRTPMNGVLGAAQLLEFTELTERQKEYVGVIRASGDGLMVLLNDILDLTKIEAGRMDLAPAEVDMSDLTPRLIGPFKAQAEAKGLAFETTVAGELPDRLRLDPLRLAQIAHNLLGNAIKFNPAGRRALQPDRRTAIGQPSAPDPGRGRQRHRHRRRRRRAPVPALHPGGRLLHPALRRHRPGLEHMPAFRRHDGWGDHGHLATRPGLDLRPVDRGRGAGLARRPAAEPSRLTADAPKAPAARSARSARSRAPAPDRTACDPSPMPTASRSAAQPRG